MLLFKNKKAAKGIMLIGGLAIAMAVMAAIDFTPP